MYDPETNEISFPHVIPGAVLGGEKRTFNSINGGIKNISNLNLVRNRFLGGNVENVGLMSEYGIYACPHYLSKRIMGFFIPSKESLTADGLRVLLERYPNAKILGNTNEQMHKILTQEQAQKKATLIDEAIERGALRAQVETNTIDELDGLIRAMDSGKAKDVLVEEATVNKEKSEGIVHVQAKRPARRR